MNTNIKINFPKYTGIRCLMMPYIQGDSMSVPEQYRSGYENIINNTFIEKGDIGYLTIDESIAAKGKPHRGDRSKTDRALHTEAGIDKFKNAKWGGLWGSSHTVKLDRDVKVLLANNTDNTCAIWDVEHPNTSWDGDIGYESYKYPYAEAVFMKNGEVHQIGIFTPHESLPVKQSVKRQFLRIVSSGVYGREPYFTENKLIRL